DPNRRTFEVDIRFVTPELRLQPGMTGELAFIERTRDRALVVPSQAVQDGAVWTIQNGRLTKSAATIGIRSIERAEITGGLAAGDVVVISPVGGIPPASQVRIGSRLDPKVAADLNKPTESQLFQGFQ